MSEMLGHGVNALEPGVWTAIGERVCGLQLGDPDRWIELPDAPLDLETARDAFDNGSIEMAQHRRGNRCLLVVLRRAKRAERPPYFRTAG